MSAILTFLIIMAMHYGQELLAGMLIPFAILVFLEAVLQSLVTTSKDAKDE
jgi:hypothetical protein